MSDSLMFFINAGAFGLAAIGGMLDEARLDRVERTALLVSWLLAIANLVCGLKLIDTI